MQFFKVLAVAASLALAHAQSKIGFTSAPAGTVEAGESVVLRWTGGTDAPVTITLKKGDPDNLETVAIITGNAEGTSFTWTPSTSLPNGADYALEISQGVGSDSTNFSGLFALTGGSSDTGSASSGSSSTAPAASGSTSVVTITSANSTTTVAETVFATGTGPIRTSATPSLRNTTFVRASSTASASRTGGLSAGTVTSTAETTPTASESSSAEGASSSGMAGQMGAQVGAVGMAIMAVVAFL